MKRTTDSFGEATACKQQRADIIRLNVGGNRMHTTPDTLSRMSYFRSLIDPDSAMGWAVEENHIFIDRDGDLFCALLNFCRTGQRPAQALLTLRRQALLEECNYFGLDAMTDAILGRTCSWDLRAEDRAIREMEAALRSGEDQQRRLCTPHAHLYDVHAMAPPQYKRPEALGYPYLLLDRAPRHHLLQGGFQDFYERLNTFSGQCLLDELMKIPSEGGNLVIAGGSVLHGLTGAPCSDLDIFVQAAPGNAAMQLLQQVYEATQKVHSKSKPKILLTRTRNAVSFYRVAEKKPCAPIVQVITKVVGDSLATFLANFDVDAACFAFDLRERKVFASSRGLRALQYGANVLDTSCASSISFYTKRLEKYSLRGFAVCVPGYAPQCVHPRVMQESYMLFPQYDNLLLKLGKTDQSPKKIKVNRKAGQSAIEAQPRITQKATRVMEGFLHMLILDAGVARVAHPPTRYLTNNGRIALANETTAVVPVGMGQGQYVLLYGLSMGEDAAEKLRMRGAPAVDEDNNNYELTPLACVHEILEQQEQHSDNPDLDNRVPGGIVEKLTDAAARSAGKAYRVCYQAQNASLLIAGKLAFVYDVISTETPFAKLRFVLQAKQAPLRENLSDDDFESTYGLPAKLTFDVWGPRTPIEGGLWDGIYE